MAEVPQSTEVHPSEQADSKETLVHSLDHLLQHYLHLLDQYQTLQHRLTQVLSKVRVVLPLSTGPQTAQGYLQLAQANFSNPNRFHYGQDYYDDRMQASTRVYGALLW